MAGEASTNDVGTALVGGGPAMLGLLATAVHSGVVDALRADGLCLLHSGPADTFGAGRLGGYLVRSDTRARVFAECAAALLAGQGAAAERVLASCDSDEPVALDVAARLLGFTGAHLLARVGTLPGVTVRSGTTVSGLHPSADGVRLRLADGGQVLARRVVLALGGRPWLPSTAATTGPAAGALVLHSDEALRPEGYASIVAALSTGEPRVTVLGGAHSAFAVAGLLLRAPLDWGRGAVTVVHRGPVRVTYPDAVTARADGLLVRSDQICPATGVVHRFGGLRADAAQLFLRVRRGSEPRIRLVRAGTAHSGDPVVVAATGYTSAVAELLPGGYWDGVGRLRDRAGTVVPRMYGLGLGTRRPRSASTGGEPAFHGAIDGVWFYQNIVAPELLRLLMSG